MISRRRRHRRRVPASGVLIQSGPALTRMRRGSVEAVLMLHGRTAAVGACVPALPAAWRRLWCGRCSSFPAAALAAAVEAAEEGEEDEATDCGGDADDDGFVVVDPGFDLAAGGGAFALALFEMLEDFTDELMSGWREGTYCLSTSTPTSTRGSRDEVLLQTITDITSEFRTCTSDETALAVTRICIVVLRVAAHDSLALLVATRALTTGALQAIATIGAIWLSLVCGAGRRGARAGFLGITLTRACTTDSTRRSELAVSAAVLVGVIADRARSKLASGRVAARIIFAAFCTSTVAIFTRFDNSITALPSRNRGDTFIVGQTFAVDRIAKHCTANVADRAWAELLNAVTRLRVHDVLSSGRTGVCVEWTALLRANEFLVLARARGTIMNSTKGMADLMGDDLPFRSTGCSNNDVGAGDRFLATAIRLAITSDTAIRGDGSSNTCLS